MIITNNEELLRVKCEDVLPEEVGTIIEALERELDNANRLGKSGIGLAAPQIGIAKKAAIIRINTVKFDLINAQLEQGFDATIFTEEGCLSFPGRIEDTLRFQEVVISNNLVSPQRFVATGLLSVVCQHELDHINSTLFMDRIAPKPIAIPLKTVIKLGPNDACSCGSGKKYKRCCRR